MLRLQDLTRSDIEIYVREILCTHQSMVALANRHPQQVTSLGWINHVPPSAIPSVTAHPIITDVKELLNR